MFTPSIRASSTSVPDVMDVKAFSTHVCVPPFLNQFPLEDEMTTGATAPAGTTAGASPYAFFPAVRRPAAAMPAAVPLRTKSRRVIRRRMSFPPARATRVYLQARQRLDLPRPPLRGAVAACRAAREPLGSTDGPSGIRRTRPRRAGHDPAGRVLRFAGDLRARGANDLFEALALRRTGRRSPGARRLCPLRGRRRERDPRAGAGSGSPGILQRL